MKVRYIKNQLNRTKFVQNRCFDFFAYSFPQPLFAHGPVIVTVTTSIHVVLVGLKACVRHLTNLCLIIYLNGPLFFLFFLGGVIFYLGTC